MDEILCGLYLIINRDVETCWDQKRAELSVEIYREEAACWEIEFTEVVGYEKAIDRYAIFYLEKSQQKAESNHKALFKIQQDRIEQV